MSKSVFAALILSAALACQPAMARCAGAAAAYELIDLGDVVADQAESRAVAIDNRGRIIVRTVPPGIGQISAEYMVEASGRAKPVTNPKDKAFRETRRLVGDRIRMADYVLNQDGFLPARTTTMIDRKGGEIDVANYCKAPEGGDWTLQTFVISDDGERAAGLFTEEERSVVASCAFDEESAVLFETSDVVSLAGINNAGDLGGTLEGRGGDVFLWRWADGERLSAQIPDDLLSVEVDGIDQEGRVFALATGEVINPAIYLTNDGGLAVVLVLPGEGWDVNWIEAGPCGTLFGEATYTNFATFIQLPEEEQMRLRQNFAEFWQYALERESALFVWSPEKRTGQFLGAVSKDTRDWSNIQITAINEDGIAVGYGDNAQGMTRAIKLVPVD